ncbi:hypothetical protein RRG08_046048 [Elysia crispata]|uniref:Uncharacterized protein n=1 Tax=Elysia crispata TaxID=231223 RepID=A0AAE1A8I4_9GAST|nr:hypothetical protein RRG08_046048 [Elysia crispata]
MGRLEEKQRMKKTGLHRGWLPSNTDCWSSRGAVVSALDSRCSSSRTPRKSREREATHSTSGLASPELHDEQSREREATHSTSGLASPELHVNLGKGRLLTAPLGWPPQNSTRQSREREATHSTSGLASPDDNFAALLINLPRKLADFASRDRLSNYLFPRQNTVSEAQETEVEAARDKVLKRSGVCAAGRVAKPGGHCRLFLRFAVILIIQTWNSEKSRGIISCALDLAFTPRHLFPSRSFSPRSSLTPSNLRKDKLMCHQVTLPNAGAMRCENLINKEGTSRIGPSWCKVHWDMNTSISWKFLSPIGLVPPPPPPPG